MNWKLDKIFKDSKRLVINNDSKLVIMSDCHRGTKDNYDNFFKNQKIYEAALLYYYNRNFTYIELGDGDEMWEVKNYKDIVKAYLDVFKQLKKFYDLNRLIMIYGNHDMVKKSKAVLEDFFYKYYDKKTNKYESLLDNLIVDESLILNYQNYDIFLVHGHQVDFLNSKLWHLARFLVRNVWRPFESIGIKDPTSSAKNYLVKNSTEKRLQKWSIKNNKMLIAGHTHRPIFPKIGQSLYFNDGSCVHPNGITCLEIENGRITLVRWELRMKDNDLMLARRRVIEGSEDIASFF